MAFRPLDYLIIRGLYMGKSKRKKKNKHKLGLSLFSVILLMTALYLLAEFSDNILDWYGRGAFIVVVIVIIFIFYIVYKFGHRSV